MITALKGISDGKPALSPQISARILDYFSSSKMIKNRKVAEDKNELAEQLTRREKDVLEKLAKGLSSQQAADELFVSYHTVASHIKSIYSKLNISSRAEVAQEAYRLGLLDN